uniref:AP3A hydrolase n=1 Tax=Romanomermis culicivorax TaxID=13658 RepID=A0A915JAA1_ROMCU
MDGLRYDFVTSGKLPSLEKLAREKAVWAPEGIINQFPTKTLTNLYSIATGLTTEHHGIVGDRMYDPDLDLSFNYWNEVDELINKESRLETWFGGQPLWKINEEQGGRSACMHFPLCDVQFGNKTIYKSRPIHQSKVFTGLSDFTVDMTILIRWLRGIDGDEPVNLAFWYINEPDQTMHNFDVHGSETNNTLADMNFLVEFILNATEGTGLSESLDIIFTSDHGITNVYKNQSMIPLDDFVKPELYFWSGKSIFPYSGTHERYLYEQFIQVHKLHPYFDIWMKEDVPEYLHYKNNSRIGPIVICEHSGFAFLSHGETLLRVADVHGTHGYSPEYKEMRPLFVAYGPSFKQNYMIPESANFRTIDIFNVICRILSLNCPKNDGNSAFVDQILVAQALANSDSLAVSSTCFVSFFLLVTAYIFM